MLITPCSSLAPCCAQGYENAEKFDPDRFSVERGEDIKYAHNFLVFGYGPHYCVGKEVTASNLVLIAGFNWGGDGEAGSVHG